MNKLIVATVALVAFAGVCTAASSEKSENEKQEIIDLEVQDEELFNETQIEHQRNRRAIWPSVIAIANWPETPDVIGLRLTLPYSTKQENVSGLDVGFWGACKDAEALQFSVIRNNVYDTFAGLQAGLYNSIGSGDLLALQAGLFNESGSFRGFQIGVINDTDDGRGFQIGLINRAETFYGFQVGLVNIIRFAEISMLPVLNIGW